MPVSFELMRGKLKMKTLNKAIDVLDCFLTMEEYVELSEIAQKSNLDKSTVDRILKTWVKRGFLKQKGNRGKYSLGSKFLDFSGIIKRRSKIREMAMPYIVKLSQISKESVILSILEGHFAAYNEVISFPGSLLELKGIPDEGTKVPLYCTGVGKILLANMTKAEINDYFNITELKSITKNTITDANKLRDQMHLITERNISFDSDEYIWGVSNVAAGIMNYYGNCIAAVGVLGPSVRLTSYRMEEIVPHVIKCASDISKSLGFNKNDLWAQCATLFDDSEGTEFIGCP